MNPRKLIVELIGTFFLVLTIGLCVIKTPTGVIPPLAIGFALMAMIYAGGHVSGAHYNPAMTLAIFLRGKMAAAEVVPYWLAQVTGAVLASGVAIYLQGAQAEHPLAFADLTKVGVGDFLFTFALAYVVLNVATARGTAGNPHYGLAISGIVMAGAFAVGSISGGAFNPAVALGLATMKIVSLKHVWVHLIADMAGGAAAGLLFRYLDPGDV